MSYELVGPASPRARLVGWLDHWRGQPRSAAASAGSPFARRAFDGTAFADLCVETDAMSSTRAAQHVKEALDQLPVQQRQMLLLHVNSGLTYWQIARRLGMAEQAVLSGLSRAYSQLSVVLSSDELQR